MPQLQLEMEIPADLPACLGEARGTQSEFLLNSFGTALSDVCDDS